MSSTYSNKSESENFLLGSRALLENLSETKIAQESLMNSEMKKDSRNGKVQSAYERIKQKYGKQNESKENIYYPESGSSASKQRSINTATPDQNLNPYLALIQSQMSKNHNTTRGKA